MLTFNVTGSRVVDFVALVTLGGTAVGFGMFLTFAPLPTPSEWNRLIGAQLIAQLERSTTAFPVSSTASSTPLSCTEAFPNRPLEDRPDHADCLQQEGSS